MACFVVPVGEAVVTAIVTKAVKAKEEASGINVSREEEKSGRLPFSRKLRWLSNMLWGGAALLAFEHVWHGEVTPWFPFLTAAGDPEDTAVMLHEMATVGTSMAILVTAVWCVMLAVCSRMERKELKTGRNMA